MKHSAKSQVNCLQDWLKDKGKWKPDVKSYTTHVETKEEEKQRVGSRSLAAIKEQKLKESAKR